MVDGPPEINLERYRISLLERYAALNMNVGGMTGPWPSARKLWDIFVPPLVLESHEYNPGLHKLPLGHVHRLFERGEHEDDYDWDDADFLDDLWKRYTEYPPRPIFDILEESRLARLVVLGEPGLGKSTLFRYLALEWASKEGTLQQESQSIPILVELSEYDRWECTGEKTILRFLCNSRTLDDVSSDDLHRWLKARRQHVCLLLDGLESIYDLNARDSVIETIKRFSNDYPQARIILTSTPIGYKPRILAAACFHHFVIQNWNEDQMKEFVQRWHSGWDVPPYDIQVKREQLENAWHESSIVCELAGNPMTLAALALLNFERELPRCRIHLFEQITRILLLAWDTSDVVLHSPQLKDKLGFNEKIELLQRVARFMQSAPSGFAGNVISHSDLDTITQDYFSKLGISTPQEFVSKLLDSLYDCHSVLVPIGGGCFSFTHKVFQEYFCAISIYEDFQNQPDRLKSEIFLIHIHDESWHGTLSLVAELLAESAPESALELIRDLLSQPDKDFQFHPVFLAARCCEEIGDTTIIEPIRTELRDVLLKIIDYDYPFFYDSDDEEYEQLKHLHQKALRRLIAFKLLDNPYEFLMDLFENSDSERFREIAISELAHGWQNESNILKLLKYSAIHDDSAHVRSTALQELVRCWKDDPDTFNILQNRATRDNYSNVVETATSLLAKGWHDDPETIAWYQNLFSDDSKIWQRESLIHEFTKYQKHDFEIMSRLKYIVLNDSYPDVAIMAFEYLAHNWKDEPDILDFIKNIALNHEQEYARRVAIEALAREWRHDIPTISFLNNLAIHEKDSGVRSWAMRELFRSRKNDPETVKLLKQSFSDKSDRVRNWACSLAEHMPCTYELFEDIKKCLLGDKEKSPVHDAIDVLARRYKEYPEVRSLVMNLAIDADSKSIRENAVEVLARNWRGNSSIMHFIMERAVDDPDEYVRSTALHELSWNWIQNEEIFLLLKNRLQEDKHEDVRQAAVEELAYGWNKHTETLQLLRECIDHEKSNFILWTAIEEIAKRWKNDPTIFTWFREYAENGHDSSVRSRVICFLARKWKTDPGTFPLLKKIAVSDHDGEARSAAISALHSWWLDDAECQEIFRDRAFNDVWGDARHSALYALLDIWSADEETRLLLKNHFLNDSDGYVRQLAIRALVNTFEIDPDLITRLKEMIVNDTETEVRGEAISSLSDVCKNDPEYISILKDRIINDKEGRVRTFAISSFPLEQSNDPEMLSLFIDRAVNDEYNIARLNASRKLEKYIKSHPEILDIIKDRAENDESEFVRRNANRMLEKYL